MKRLRKRRILIAGTAAAVLAALILPPRFRKNRSSTVNQWAMWRLFSSHQAVRSSREKPASRFLQA